MASDVLSFVDQVQAGQQDEEGADSRDYDFVPLGFS
jgi:hypothetical protein